MIRGKEAEQLRSRAERSGEAKDWADYAEYLERAGTGLSPMLIDPQDAEQTVHTSTAHDLAAEALRTMTADYDGWRVGGVQIVDTDTGAYALEVRGQLSAVAHGFQGFRPDRGTLLLTLWEQHRIPVFLAFLDGQIWETAWLHHLPMPSRLKLADDRNDARVGWYAGAGSEKRERLFDRSEVLTLPAGPNYETLGQASLLG